MTEEPIVLGMQQMKKLQNVPSPTEPYLSQAQAAVAAARKALGMSPREVLLCFLQLFPLFIVMLGDSWVII
jgi:hypothetical protein